MWWPFKSRTKNITYVKGCIHAPHAVHYLRLIGRPNCSRNWRDIVKRNMQDAGWEVLVTDVGDGTFAFSARCPCFTSAPVPACARAPDAPPVAARPAKEGERCARAPD